MRDCQPIEGGRGIPDLRCAGSQSSRRCPLQYKWQQRDGKAQCGGRNGLCMPECLGRLEESVEEGHNSRNKRLHKDCPVESREMSASAHRVGLFHMLRSWANAKPTNGWNVASTLAVVTLEEFVRLDPRRYQDGINQSRDNHSESDHNFGLRRNGAGLGGGRKVGRERGRAFSLEQIRSRLGIVGR